MSKDKSQEDIKAEEEAARSKALASAQGEAEKDRQDLEKRLAKLEQQANESQRKADEAQAELSDLRSQLGKPGGGEKPAVKMRSEALDAEKAHARLRDIWPLTGRRFPPSEPMVGKTFKVTPTGRLGSGMAPAIVENCSDEGDAKAAYFKGREEKAYKVSVKVEPHGDTKDAMEAQRNARYAEWDARAKAAQPAPKPPHAKTA